MTMAYSEEQRALRTAAERFAREKLAPRYQTREQEGRIDRALLREMGALGLIAGDLAESHGGLGLSSETTGLIDGGARLRRRQCRLCAIAWLAMRPDHRPPATRISLQLGCRASSPARASSRLPSPNRAADQTPPISPCRHGRSTPVMCSTARNPRSALPTRPMPFWSLLALGASRTAPTASAPFSCP